MNQIAQIRPTWTGRDGALTVNDFVRDNARVLDQPQVQPRQTALADESEPLEKIKESLACTYLANNLKLKNLPLKALMDGCEKKILLTCLLLTGGNQKNAAAIMGIKPTVLFEKMRKHGISRKQLQSSGAWDALLPIKDE